jgi:hypothetical protein
VEDHPKYSTNSSCLLASEQGIVPRPQQKHSTSLLHLNLQDIKKCLILAMLSIRQRNNPSMELFFSLVLVANQLVSEQLTIVLETTAL